MSNARQETVDETIDDILRDMRTDDIRATANTSSAVERKAFKYINDFLADYADRIEAAAKRECEAGAEAAQICGEIGEMVGREASKKQSVTNCNRLGNAARMREALMRCADIINKFGLAEILETPIEVICDIEGIITAALSEPPRNCDRPECATTDAAQEVWRKEDGGNTAYFLTGKQSPTIPRTFRSSFDLFLARHGIERFNFHRLRHTFATRCIEAGVDAKTTSELLGHANVNITLNLYVHPNVRAKRAAVDRMAAAFGGCGKESEARSEV